MTAQEAAERLGVKLATLYAYASRGLLRSQPSGEGPARLYLRADVERLRARSAARRGGPPAGGQALRMGEPVLDTRITWLGDEGPVYRGYPAVDLAVDNVSFEAAAELLWSGELPREAPHWRVSEPGLPLGSLHQIAPPGTPALELLPLIVAGLGVADPDRYDTAPAAVLARARVIIRRCIAWLAASEEPERLQPALDAPSAAEALITALGLRDDAPARATIDAALVLLADHELNASTFAARVTASTGADLYGCLQVGFATLAGPRHGAASTRVRAVVDEIGHPERAAHVLRERTRRGDLIPGFGHLVYRVPDPRAAPLLEAARELAPDDPVVRTVDALIDAMADADRPPPNVDCALVSVAAALGMPPEATPALFAIARMAGWTAHVLEQYEAPFIVRPRARYLEGS
jgi:citrate synthase